MSLSFLHKLNAGCIDNFLVLQSLEKPQTSYRYKNRPVLTMKKTMLLLAFMLGININAQTTFEKSNFVNKQGNAVECFIKNYDWAFIPKEIEYKINENDEVSTMPASQLNSFYIYGTSHNYKMYDVPIIGIQKGDVFVKSGPQLLKVLVEGKASLLKSNDGIYILALEGEMLKPLIYKKYINGDTFEENVAFRLELYNTLKCESLELADFKKLRYTDKQLISVVNEYNNCQGGESKNFKSQKSNIDFNIKLVAGANFYSINTNMQIVTRYYQSDFESFGSDEKVNLQSNPKNNFVAGFEAELRIPFNHRKWAIFIVPTYNTQSEFSQSISRKTDFFIYDHSLPPSEATHRITYNGTAVLSSHSYIEVPFGLRYYFILNRNSSLNINAAYGTLINVGTQPKFIYKKDDDDVYPSGFRVYYKTDKSSQSVIRLGAGYTFKEKYSVGINYYVSKKLQYNDTNGAVSVLLGYKIL
ncbi:hypothetical protein ACLI09_00575 [Flavobacterium sp. RHBU_24]|uniref:hypothetical protein n=1 Tax=Flavobacterium sp. RHBU_24 TaxID=3391185 RepID=UPI003984DDD7